MAHELKEEQKHMKDDVKDGIDATAPIREDQGPTPVTPDPTEEDPLRDVLTGFFASFDEHERRFKGRPHENLKDGHPVYEQVKALHERIHDMLEEDLQAEINKVDLAGEDITTEIQAALPLPDLVEEITLMPKIPDDKLKGQ